VQKRILRREEHRILWVFPADRYPTSNPLEELEVRRRLRRHRHRLLVSFKKDPHLAAAQSGATF